VKHFSDLADARLTGEARSLRDRLLHLLNALDELPEPQMELRATATVERIRTVLRARRMRDQFFEPALFADPAWDILLELYLAELAQYRASVGTVCIGAAVAATTALRWINLLEKKGLVLRRPDPNDARRFYLSLSAEATKAMDSFFTAVDEPETVV
jgi:DNA-binding MarR family transcriptional regulator